MDGITVDVAGIGPIGFPVSVAQARKLARLGTLVHGSGWDVPRGLVSIEWDEAGLGSVLAGLREGPGLPWQCELNAAVTQLSQEAPRNPCAHCLRALISAALLPDIRHKADDRQVPQRGSCRLKAVITIAGAGFQSANARIPYPLSE
jgi:hypothetical protein